MKEQFGRLLAIVGVLIGLFFAGIAIYYYYLWSVDVDNPLRHEYTLGIGIGVLWASPAFIAASIGAFMDRKRLSKFFIIPLHIVSTCIALGFGYLLIWS